MKKLTEVQMWKALGFTKFNGGRGGLGGWKRGGRIFTPPPFYTSDLSAIVAEYRARKIPFQLQVDETGAIAHADGKKAYSIGTHDNTAPLALAQALLAYLKEAPKGSLKESK